jgi:hypothetical protein
MAARWFRSCYPISISHRLPLAVPRRCSGRHSSGHSLRRYASRWHPSRPWWHCRRWQPFRKCGRSCLNRRNAPPRCGPRAPPSAGSATRTSRQGASSSPHQRSTGSQTARSSSDQTIRWAMGHREGTRRRPNDLGRRCAAVSWSRSAPAADLGGTDQPYRAHQCAGNPGA